MAADVKAIVFDLDGTVSDTYDITVLTLQQVIKEQTGKYMESAEIQTYFGPTDIEALKKIAGIHYSKTMLEIYLDRFKNNLVKFVKPIQGMNSLLDLIKEKKIKLGLFTGRSGITAKIILDHLELYDKFDTILPGDNIAPKPDDEGLRIIMNKMNLLPHEMIYAGDFATDITASRNAGAVSCLVTWCTTNSHQSDNPEPDYHFETPLQFMSWLSGSVII